MNTFSSYRSKGNAFTLTELLITVAIIAALVALLLPTYNQMIGRAHIAGCLNNLRTIGMAWHQYIGDHDGALPKADSNWWAWGGFDTGGIIKSPPIPARILVDYIDSDKTYICPADERNHALDQTAPIWKTRGTSYASNEQLFYKTGISGGGPSRYLQIQHPSRTIVIGDTTIRIASSAASKPSGYQENYTWHTSPGGGWKSNVVFADCHAALIEIDTASPTPGEDYQWKPD